VVALLLVDDLVLGARAVPAVPALAPWAARALACASPGRPPGEPGAGEQPAEMVAAYRTLRDPARPGVPNAVGPVGGSPHTG
jgi:hypothetical protein